MFNTVYSVYYRYVDDLNEEYHTFTQVTDDWFTAMEWAAQLLSFDTIAHVIVQSDRGRELAYKHMADKLKAAAQ